MSTITASPQPFLPQERLPVGHLNWMLLSLSKTVKITDSKGKPVSLSHTHRFRHTQLARFAELGLPVHVLMRYAWNTVTPGDGQLRITGLVEKPSACCASSSYAAIGGYVVTPGIIDELRAQTRHWYEHKTGEVYLTDAINAYAATRAVYGQVIKGRWYDTGNPADYLVAQMAQALAHPEYGPILRRPGRRTRSPPCCRPPGGNQYLTRRFLSWAARPQRARPGWAAPRGTPTRRRTRHRSARHVSWWKSGLGVRGYAPIG